MKKVLGVICGTLILIGTGAQAATQFLGGNSLFHTYTSTNLQPGLLAVQLHTRGWATTASGRNLSNVSQALTLSFGFSPHIELEVAPMLFQDLNLSGTGDVTNNSPDDVYLRFKFGGFQMNMFNRTIGWGVVLGFRAHSAKIYNVYLEPYNGGANEVLISTTFSYYTNVLYPLEGPSMHFNLGYLNHNDGGSTEALDIFSNVSHDLEYAFAYRYPTRRWDFFGELYGNIFLQRPSKYAYTRANVIWLQPGMTFRAFAGLSVTLGLDLRLLESGPELYYADQGVPAGVVREQTRPNTDFPDYYPAWRLAGKISFMPSTTFRRFDSFAEVRPESERDWEMREKTGMSEREIIDWLGAEEEGAEFLDLELEKIRAERRKAEQELERLREKLAEEQN